MSYFIGLLSGTSVDGIDAALIDIERNKIELISSFEKKFSDNLHSTLQNIIKTQNVNLETLASTDVMLAQEFASAVNDLLENSHVDKEKITAIGFHGQTIFHQPNGDTPNTLQIGSAHALAALTRIDVVHQFRNLDMAYGGQGAPLAPLLHHKLYASPNFNSAIINLGGITNISFIGKDYPQPVGFDVGPANCLLDEWIAIHQGQAYDNNGNWARQGQLDESLLSGMLNDEYFHKHYPKSTGREYFNLDWLKKFGIDTKDISARDIQNTLTHLVAASIAQSVKQQDQSIEKIILMGGGAKNSYLKNLIQDYSQIKTTRAENSDWIEAILFAYLAHKRINQQKLDLSSITGTSAQFLVGDIVRA